MTNPPQSVDEETLARWRADPDSIPDDMEEVAKSYGWRGPGAGWAPPFGPVPPPEPIDAANQNVIEYELEKLGLDINGANWVIAPAGNFTRVAFDLDPDSNPTPLGRAPWDRSSTRCIIKLERNEVSNADSRYTCYIEVWDRRRRRLTEAGRSVLDYEGPEYVGPGIDKDKYNWFQNEAVAENPYQAVRRALRELLGDGFAFGELDEQAATEWGNPPAPTATPPAEDDVEPEMTAEEKRAYNEQRVTDLIETVEQDLPPEESWSGIDEAGNPTPPPKSPDPSVAAGEAASSFFRGRWLIAAIIAGIVVAALLGLAFLGGGDDTSEVPANVPANSGAAVATVAAAELSLAPAVSSTGEGQIPIPPDNWGPVPSFTPSPPGSDDPHVRWSSGGSLWAQQVWTTAVVTPKAVDNFQLRQTAQIKEGATIVGEFLISADCAGDTCSYSTLYDDLTVELVANGNVLTGSYRPEVEGCYASGTYRLEVTDLTVINNRLVPDFIRGERTLDRVCSTFDESQVVEINGRYLFRGSYADQ